MIGMAEVVGLWFSGPGGRRSCAGKRKRQFGFFWPGGKIWDLFK
jgi:hypothetical protein